MAKGGGKPKPPCHRKKLAKLPIRRAKLGGKFLGFLGIFREFFGNFGEFSILIMINNYI